MAAFAMREVAEHVLAPTSANLRLGDGVLAPEWRLWARAEAANGLRNFDLLTAALRQVHLGQVNTRRKRGALPGPLGRVHMARRNSRRRRNARAMVASSRGKKLVSG